MHAEDWGTDHMLASGACLITNSIMNARLRTLEMTLCTWFLLACSLPKVGTTSRIHGATEGLSPRPLTVREPSRPRLRQSSNRRLNLGALQQETSQCTFASADIHAVTGSTSEANPPWIQLNLGICQEEVHYIAQPVKPTPSHEQICSLP